MNLSIDKDRSFYFDNTDFQKEEYLDIVLPRGHIKSTGNLSKDGVFLYRIFIQLFIQKYGAYCAVEIGIFKSKQLEAKLDKNFEPWLFNLLSNLKSNARFAKKMLLAVFDEDELVFGKQE